MSELQLVDRSSMIDALNRVEPGLAARAPKEARGAVLVVSPRAWEGLASLRVGLNRLTGSGSRAHRR